MLTWYDSVDKIKGLGPKRSNFLAWQGYRTVGDLLLRAPLRLIDQRGSLPLKELSAPQRGEITAIGRIESVGEKGFRSKRRFLVYISDGTGYVTGVWFKAYRYIIPKMQPGVRVAFHGRLTFFDGPQIIHPKVTFLDDDLDLDVHPGIIPVYPSGAEWQKVKLDRRYWPQLIRQVISEWDGGGTYVPEEIRRVHKLVHLREAIKGVHLPESTEEYDRALEALKFAELFHHQLLMVALRRRRRQGEGIRMEPGGLKYDRFIEELPFDLSTGQEKVLDEIKGDFTAGRPMYRLLQGEVGAGKTVLALAAATMVASNDHQTAIMAPTELLARQHYRKAIDWCEPAGLKAVLITAGRDPDEQRRALYEAAVGHADLIIGTHALFYEKVKLPRLGLVVIDEQQRFGVRQRARLVGKGRRPHVLLMTATPIPRTLSLSFYGDLDLSLLPPLPGKRRQVRTRVVNDGKRDNVFGWLREKLKKGERGYLVFPVIEEGSAGLEAAEARFKPYQQIDFKGIPMALVHGRVPIEQRVRAMDDFRAGRVRLLVATAVVEVGVDVPEASLMVVENAERFGLSQLHQLRGRIGRLGKRAVCVLLSPELPGEAGFERLKLLEGCDDGMKLAEEDLRMRGSGDPLGAKQSGIVRFRLADLAQDYQLLKRAHYAAEMLLEKYPDLAPFPELRTKLRQDYRARPRTLLAG